MANTNAPFGFRSYQGQGPAPTYNNFAMLIASNNTTPIFNGDAVIQLATGYIGQATAGTATLAGVFIGCRYTSVSQKRTVWMPYWPGSDATGDVEAYVINDPNTLFVAQAGGTAIGIADIGANIQLNVGTGNTSTGISGMYVETPAVTATLPFRIVGLVTAPPGANGTDLTTPYNQVILAPNNWALKNSTGI